MKTFSSDPELRSVSSRRMLGPNSHVSSFVRMPSAAVWSGAAASWDEGGAGHENPSLIIQGSR